MFTSIKQARLLKVISSFTAWSLMIGAAYGASSSALNNQLKGTFPFNETIIAAIATVPPSGTCPKSVTNGSTDLNVVQHFSLTNQGTWSFDGAGNVNMDDTGVQVTWTPYSSKVEVAASSASCKGNYSVNSDASIDFHYYCSLPNPSGSGYVTFDVTAKGFISKNIVQVSVPNSGPNQILVTPVYISTLPYTITGATPAGCSVVGENTTIGLNQP